MQDQLHQDLTSGLYEQQKLILNSSEQAIYMYLDDAHKVCNQRFASLLGYDSPNDWARVKESFPTAFVDPKSQETLVNAYRTAMEKLVGSAFQVTWRKKLGGTVETRVILVPIGYLDHVFALHFVAPLN